MSRLLGGRGALNVLFGLYFLLVASSGGTVLQQAGGYFLGDGLLASALAYALQRERAAPWRVGVEVASALARVLLGAWFLLVPALSDQVLTSVLVLVVLCAAAVGLGAGEVALALAYGRHSAGFWRAIAAAGLAIVAGIAMFYAFPDVSRIRTVLGVYALAHGLLLLAAGWRGAPGMPRAAS